MIKSALMCKAQEIKKTAVDYRRSIVYRRRFKSLLNDNGYANVKEDGEDAYITKWKELSNSVEPYSYRLFSHYLGNCQEIVPESVGRFCIEPILNPKQMRSYYTDKNVFPLICGKKNVPKTFICRINGSILLDGDFLPIRDSLNDILNGEKRLILKPSVGSASGRNIILFCKRGEDWVSSLDGSLLTTDYLLKYSKDFILQHAIDQHEGMSVFNPSSVNTIRVAVYRSVLDEEPHVCACIMRVGRSGEYVDNAHRGGYFVA